MMQHYVLGDIVTEISERENNPSSSPYERFVGLEHYVSGEVEIENYGSTSNLNSAMKVFKSGDIMVARRNVYLKRASVVYFDGLTSGDSIVLRPNDETIGRILPFILNTDDFWDYADQHSDGTMSKRLSPKVLKKYEFDLPDENLEQLADILWAMIDVKKSYQNLLKQTDDLVKSQFIEMFGDPFDNEKGLPVEPLSKHIELLGGFAFKSTGFVKDGIPVLRIGNINAGYFRPDDLPFWEYDPALDRYLLYPGDLAISLTGTVGKDDYGNVCRLGDDYPRYYLNQRNAKLILKETVLPEYITALLKNRKVKNKIANAGVGVRQANISNKTILELEIPVPGMEAQKQFELIVRQSDKSKFELKQAIEGVDVLIKSLIQQELN